MNVVENILKSKAKLYLTVTGGGTGAISTLLENGGGSSVFLGARVPYSSDELRSVVGSGHAAKPVSAMTAILLANYPATQSIVDTLPDIEPSDEQDNAAYCVSVGSTCSLVKDNERAERKHTIFLAVSYLHKDNKELVDNVYVELNNGRTRKEEEDLVSRLILAMADCRMNLTKSYPLQNKHTLKWIGLTDKDVFTWREDVPEAS